MMVAAYQKFLENDTLGLTNATKEVKSLIQTYGETGLQMDGHSRGTLTITNAYSSLLNDGDTGKYTNLRTNMVGAAANVKNADRKLAELQGRNIDNYDEQEKSAMSIHVQGHTADPVHRVIGLNAPTGVTTKPDNALGGIKEAVNSMIGKKTSAHNCYGVGKKECGNDEILENKQPMKWKPVYKPQNMTIPQIETPVLKTIEQTKGYRP